MVELYQFMTDNPWLGALLIVLSFCLATMPFRLINRYIRHQNISARGWPPAHLDADGDFRPNDANGGE